MRVCFLINKNKNLGITFSCGKKRYKKKWKTKRFHFVGRAKLRTGPLFSEAPSNMSAATFLM